MKKSQPPGKSALENKQGSLWYVCVLYCVSTRIFNVVLYNVHIFMLILYDTSVLWAALYSPQVFAYV